MLRNQPGYSQLVSLGGSERIALPLSAARGCGSFTLVCESKIRAKAQTGRVTPVLANAKPFLLISSCLIERVRGSRFRAVLRHREDFANADCQFQKNNDRFGVARFASGNRQASVVGIRRAYTNGGIQKIADCF